MSPPPAEPTSPNRRRPVPRCSPGTRAPGSNRIAQHTAAALRQRDRASSPRPPRWIEHALGIVLVVIGLFALLIVLSGVDLTESGWPLFIIIPGSP